MSASLFDARFFGFVYDSVVFTLLFAAFYDLKHKPGSWQRFKHAYFSGIPTYLKAFALFIATLAIGMLCYGFAPAFLNTGWIELLFAGAGSDNLVLIPLQHAPAGSIELAGLGISTWGLFLALFLLMPAVTCLEENYFRKGYLKSIDILRQTVKFGLAHLLVGVPLIFAFVLMLPGYAYARRYCNGYLNSCMICATEDAAIDQGLIQAYSLHTLFNAWVLSALLLTQVL